MSYGKGVLPIRKIEKILKYNGYVYIRNNGHQIWKGSDGSTIVVPRSCCTYIVNKMFKENNIEMC